MQRKGINAAWASLALTMLSLAEFLTYVIASFLGDYLKDRLVYVNIVSSGSLATICIVWPLIDVTYGLILIISLGQPSICFFICMSLLCELLASMTAIYSQNRIVSGLFRAEAVSSLFSKPQSLSLYSLPHWSDGRGESSC